MERLGLSRCVISGAIFFLAIGSVGCDDRSSPEIVEPGDAAKKAGIEGYSNVVVKDSAAVVKATIHHANEAFDGARLTSVRNRESGKWNLRLEAPSGTTDVDWRPRSGQVTVTGSKGRKTVKARSSYKSRTQYEATGESKTRAYQREIELAALAHDDLTMPEETPVGVEPPQTYEPNYISPDSVQALEELTSEKSSMKRSSPSDGSPPIVRASLSGRKHKKASCTSVAARMDLCRRHYVNNTSAGGSSVRASFDANADLSYQCTNEACIGWLKSTDAVALA